MQPTTYNTSDYWANRTEKIKLDNLFVLGESKVMTIQAEVQTKLLILFTFWKLLLETI